MHAPANPQAPAPDSSTPAAEANDPWMTDPHLRAEFGDCRERWEAYNRAVAAGRARTTLERGR